MSWSPASGRRELEARLQQIGGRPDEDIDLAEAGLLLGAINDPKAPLERYRHHLSLLVRDTADLGARLGAADSLEARARALQAILAERYEYRGDQNTYEDLQNANLLRVIDRRRGLPVTLGVLYIHAAAQQGWEISGINFPAHFMIRLQLGGERAVLDPFHGGVRRDTADLRAMLKAFTGKAAELTPEHYAPVGRRDILLRLQNNIKLRLLGDKRQQDALEVLETMLMIAPGSAALWREAGILHVELGHLRAGILSLEQYLQLGGQAPDRHEVAAVLQRLRAQLH
ncbi:MAG: transglutaminase-like domain-containing protein [Kiloniellales bacterium]